MKAMSKAQKKVGSVMKEFGSGKLHSGKGGPVAGFFELCDIHA